MNSPFIAAIESDLISESLFLQNHFLNRSVCLSCTLVFNIWDAELNISDIFIKFVTLTEICWPKNERSWKYFWSDHFSDNFICSALFGKVVIKNNCTTRRDLVYLTSGRGTLRNSNWNQIFKRLLLTAQYDFTITFSKCFYPASLEKRIKANFYIYD